MMKLVHSAVVLLLVSMSSPLFAQPPQGRGGPPGGFRGVKRELLDQFDANTDGWLNQEERAAARKFIKENPPERRGGRAGRGGGGRRSFDPEEMFKREDKNSDGRLTKDEVENVRFIRDFSAVDKNGDEAVTLEEFNAAMEAMMRRGRRGSGGNRPAPKPGEKIAIEDVKPAKGKFYDLEVLRTIFIEFENDDWELELQEFHNSDVEVPATLTVDGKQYPLCGIRFRGMSSYMLVRAGSKRSFNVALDLVDDKQRLYGYKTLNLLNCNGDATMMSTVLYSQLASKHMPVPKANLVRVVVNGENWGVYANTQQFNKEFLREHYSSAKGTRWKVEGSPRGGGGLDYRGPDRDQYGHPYLMKDGDDEALDKLIELCRIMEEVPADKLKSALVGKIDIDELLWFLAYDNALCNSDGYWVRASDYSIFLDKKDMFHILPHDMNEAFREARAPGGRGGSRGGGPGGERPRGDRPGAGGPPRGDAEPNSPRGLDPLIGLDDDRKPLRSKILTVPEFREQYLANIRAIAEQLKWDNLGPVVAQLRNLIQDELKRDTRKLGSYEDFVRLTGDLIPAPVEAEPGEGRRGRGGRSSVTLRKFSEDRRAFLLKALDAKAERKVWLTK